MKKVIAVALVVSFTLATVFANGTTEEEENVTLRFSWWGDSRTAATLKAIELYEQENPNVKIEAEYTSFSGYYQKLITQLASGNAPDFYQVDQGWVAELYARGNAFADMHSFKTIDASAFPQTMIDDYCLKDGKLVVLPLGYNGTVFLYNKTLLADYVDENGQLGNLTWDRFEQIGTDLHAKHPDSYMTVAVTDGYVRYVLKPMIEQITNKISVQDDKTVGFTVEEMTKTFDEFLKIFTTATAQPYSESVIYDTLQNNPLWLNGKIGGVFLFFSNIDGEIKNLPYDWDVATLPRFEGAKTSGQEVCPSLMVAINSNTSSVKQEEAAKFIQWLLNDPEAAVILKTERGVPASSTALKVLTENDLLSPHHDKGIEISSATVGFKNGDYEMDSSVQALFVEKMEKAIYGLCSTKQAAQELHDEMTTLLSEKK